MAPAFLPKWLCRIKNSERTQSMFRTYQIAHDDVDDTVFQRYSTRRPLQYFLSPALHQVILCQVLASSLDCKAMKVSADIIAVWPAGEYSLESDGTTAAKRVTHHIT